MEIGDKIAALSQRVAKLKDGIETEEATKNAFIMPFLSALGYDVFDPNVVVPEFTADVGVKKGEKVDYAIKRDGKIVILVECKPCTTSLTANHTSQLYRYYSVTEARFGLLTNGVQFWFYTELDQPNKMDAKPFFEFDILNYRPAQIEELAKFANENFDVTTILETASDLKYTSQLMREIAAEIDNPSDEFKRMIVSRVYDGKLTSGVMTKFGLLTQRAMKETIRELLNQRLSSAMVDPAKTALPLVTLETVASNEASPAGDVERDVVTTQEEADGFQIVRAILREVVRVDRIAMRDSKSYCAILLDDNNRKPICRLHLNRSVKYLGLFGADKTEERVKIEGLDDIFQYADQMKATALGYDHNK